MNRTSLRTAFFGTPAIAVPFLERLSQISQVQWVVASPDQPAGRGYALKAPETKTAAERLGLRVLQPEKLNDPAFLAALREAAVDVAVVVAYGKLLPPDVLEIPRFGFLNVHFSLLPKYRGAAPMQWALIHGEKETGVTLFWLDQGMDTGPIFLQERLGIDAADNGETLRQKLVALGMRQLDEAIARLAEGKKEALPQTGEASRAPLLKKEDGQVDWNQPAASIVNLWRGLTPWPGIYTFVRHDGQAQRLKLLHVEAAPASENAPAGTVIRLESGVGPLIKCKQDALLLREVQPGGKKAMTGWAFWQGAKVKVGDSL